MNWFKEKEKQLKAYLDVNVICKCGCRNIIPVYVDKGICKWCGRTLTNTSKLHFKYKLRKELEV